MVLNTWTQRAIDTKEKWAQSHGKIYTEDILPVYKGNNNIYHGWDIKRAKDQVWKVSFTLNLIWGGPVLNMRLRYYV